MLPDSRRNVCGHKELRAKATKCQEINHYLRSQHVRKQLYRRSVSVADSQTPGRLELRLDSFEQSEANIQLVCRSVGRRCRVTTHLLQEFSFKSAVLFTKKKNVISHWIWFQSWTNRISPEIKYHFIVIVISMCYLCGLHSSWLLWQCLTWEVRHDRRRLCAVFACMSQSGLLFEWAN